MSGNAHLGVKDSKTRRGGPSSFPGLLPCSSVDRLLLIPADVPLRLGRNLNRTGVVLGVAVLGMSAIVVGGCNSIDSNGCSSSDIFVDFPQSAAPNTTVRLTINGRAFEMVCPRAGAYLLVTGGGTGGCGMKSLTLYLSDTPPSQVVDVSLHAEDANGVTVFDVPKVTFSPNVTMPDPDGMPGICYVTSSP
jgi:hypothetical protein